MSVRFAEFPLGLHSSTSAFAPLSPTACFARCSCTRWLPATPCCLFPDFLAELHTILRLPPHCHHLFLLNTSLLYPPLSHVFFAKTAMILATSDGANRLGLQLPDLHHDLLTSSCMALYSLTKSHASLSGYTFITSLQASCNILRKSKQLHFDLDRVVWSGFAAQHSNFTLRCCSK